MAEQPMSAGGGQGGQDADPLLGDQGGVPLISNAASAALAIAQRQAAMRAQQAGPGGGVFQGGGMIPGVTMPKPVMPQPPIHADPTGIIPQGPFGTVGERKRADTQAIFSNISNLAKQVQDRQYKQKVEKLQQKFEILADAMRGLNEGKATGNQGMIKQNADIINRMFHDDPKLAKEMSKAFDVNLNPMAQQKGKGQQKPTPELDAMKAAWTQDQKDFQEGRSPLTPQSQAMMRGMPQTMQPDPRWQQYLEGLKAGAFPKASDQLTYEKGIMDIQEKIIANQVTNDTKMKMSENLGKAMLDRTKMQQYGAMLRTQMMQLGAEDRARIMADALMYRADQVLKGQTDRTNMYREKLEKATTDDGKKLKLYMDGLDKAAKKNSKDMEDAKKQGDTARMKWLNQQADGIAYQQRLANDRAATIVGLDPQEPPDPKKMGLSESEYDLFRSIFTDTTQPSGEKEPSDDEE